MGIIPREWTGTETMSHSCMHTSSHKYSTYSCLSVCQRGACILSH